MVWGCISLECTLDLEHAGGTFNGKRCSRDILQPVLLSHFHNHPLSTLPVFMDDNARPNRSRLTEVLIKNNGVA